MNVPDASPPPLVTSESQRTEQRQALVAVWAGSGVISGVVATMQALLFVPAAWSVLIMVLGGVLGAGVGVGLASVSIRLGVRSSLSTGVAVAAVAFGSAAASTAAWNWLYPSLQDALDSYGDGCLASTPFGSHAASMITGPAVGDDLVTVVSRDRDDAVQFRFPANTFRAALTPADQHTRSVLATAGCPPR